VVCRNNLGLLLAISVKQLFSLNNLQAKSSKTIYCLSMGSSRNAWQPEAQALFQLQSMYYRINYSGLINKLINNNSWCCIFSLLINKKNCFHNGVARSPEPRTMPLPRFTHHYTSPAVEKFFNLKNRGSRTSGPPPAYTTDLRRVANITFRVRVSYDTCCSL
jgi:hypothetical protein